MYIHTHTHLTCFRFNFTCVLEAVIHDVDPYLLQNRIVHFPTLKLNLHIEYET